MKSFKSIKISSDGVVDFCFKNELSFKINNSFIYTYKKDDRNLEFNTKNKKKKKRLTKKIIKSF